VCTFYFLVKIEEEQIQIIPEKTAENSQKKQPKKTKKCHLDLKIILTVYGFLGMVPSVGDLGSNMETVLLVTLKVIY
jgi:hypothetical protein